MFFAEEESPFGVLPPELVVDILKSVDVYGKREARLVCHRWQKILDDPGSKLTLFRATVHGEESLRALVKTRVLIQTLHFGRVQKTYWAAVKSSGKSLPLIREIILSMGLSGESALTAFEFSYVCLESLSIEDSALASVNTHELVRILPEIAWNHLSNLDLNVNVPSADSPSRKSKKEYDERGRQMSHSRAIQCFLTAALIPQLKTFRFYLQSNRYQQLGTMMSVILSEFTLFIERHASTLRDLNFTTDLFLNESLTFCLSDPIFSPQRQESIARSLKIESLRIQISHVDSLRCLVPPCLFSLDSLTSFTWSPSYWISNRTMPPYGMSGSPLPDLMQSCRNSLVRADIKFSVGEPDIFQLDWLKVCDNLQELRLRKFDRVLNTQLRLPQVTRLAVHTRHSRIIAIGMLWVCRTFENVQFISVSGLILLPRNDCDWLKNLLYLPKLQEILYLMYPRTSHSEAWEFEGYVRKFCFMTSRLQYKRPGLINVFPE